jgi:hypothetical protein
MSCEVETQSNPDPQEAAESTIAFETIDYTQFTPKVSNIPSTVELGVDVAFELDSFTLVSGYDPLFVDTINGWGDRLYVFDSKNELIYKSRGVGDPYLYEPHFYRNDANDKTIIICQLAFEYYFGGDVFLFENGKINYIGNIGVDGDDTETRLVDIVKIREAKDEITFTFDRDTVCYDPAGETEMVESKGLNYTYKKGVFQLNK